ncbi:hypothetical protein BDQ17DRAFT_692376 [Cyathus striatus]|nr:hypothetical protein BDQ17DRAFT_692376 [Cyathus striatus]
MNSVTAISAPQLIGCLVNFTLYGVLFVQIYIYRLNFPSDNDYVKLLVYFIFIFETAQTCMNGADIYRWFSAGFGDVSEFSKPGLSPIYTPMMGSITALIVQLFFCYRIWVVKKSYWYLPCIIGMISFAQAIAGFIGGVLALLQQDVAKRFDDTAVVYVWLVGDTTADTLIAIAMTVILTKLNSGRYRQTNDVIAKIVRLTIETNATSAGIALLGLVLFAGSKNTEYFITP